MSYTERETSLSSGQPIECYEFVGTYSSYRYTSGDRNITVNSKLFTPLPIRRTNIKAGTHDEDGLDVQLEFPSTSKLAKDHAFAITPPKLLLTIYRVHVGDDYNNDYVIYWTGPVSSITVEMELAKVRIPSIFGNALAGEIPSVYYQGPCNHVLFDSGCKLSKAAHSVLTTIVDIEGLSVTIASKGGFPDGYFVGGVLTLTDTNESRMITAHADTLLGLSYPLGRAAAGAAVQVTAGCDHAFQGHCKSRFNNTINFGGFPFIPTIDPFKEGF